MTSFINRKYVTYRNSAIGGPIEPLLYYTDNMHKNLVKIGHRPRPTCKIMLADRHIDGWTHMQSYTLQYSAILCKLLIYA